MEISTEDIKYLAKKVGDSFYILHLDRFRKNYIDLLTAFRSRYKNTHIAYSYKTNYIPKVCKALDELGGYAEVVSSMEYNLARKIGVKPQKIIYNGPYKDRASIEKALIEGATVNIDSIYEIDIIDKIISKFNNQIFYVGIRVNFNVDDGVLSRFGFDIESEDFKSALDFLLNKKSINFTGFHCHYATRHIESWINRTKGIKALKDDLDINPTNIDLGGGLYGRMPESLKKQFSTYIPTFEEYAEKVSENIGKDLEFKLFIEPGSALVGDSMSFVTKLINIKNIRGKYIGTLTGSVYNINPTLNGKNSPINIHNVIEKDEITIYKDMDLAGFTCIESDYLYKGFEGKISVGDYVEFENVGSYSIVLKPPFILPNFPVINYDKKEDTVEIVKRQETFDDIFNSYSFI